MSNFAKKVLSVVSGLAVVATAVIPTSGVSAAMTQLSAANELAELGIIVDQSSDASAYRLSDTITREELSKVISQLGGLTAVDGDSVYLDTDFAPWAVKYANALNEAGYAASNPLFNPKRLTSKAEALKWVMDSRDIATGEGSSWQEARVDGAVEAGIATSFSDYGTNVTRGQVFVWAAEALNMEEEDDILGDILDGLGDDEEDDEVTTTLPQGNGELTVTLSPETPVSTTVPGGANGLRVATYDFTADDEDVTISQISVKRTGLSDEDTIDRIALFTEGGRISNAKSDNQDNDTTAQINLDDGGLVVMAGETVTVYVVADLGSSQSPDFAANDEFALQISQVRSNAGEVDLSGNLKGNSMKIGSIDAPKLVIEPSGSVSNPNLGEKGADIFEFEIEGANDEDVILQSITFESNGDADDDFANFELRLGNTVVATTSRMTGDYLTFIFDGGLEIEEDKNEDFTVRADVIDGAGDDIQFRIDERLDVRADSTKFGFGAAVDITAVQDFGDLGNLKIEAGELTIIEVEAPNDEIREDKDNVILGGFEMINLSGEFLELEEFGVTISLTSTGSAFVDTNANNALDGGETISADTVFDDVELYNLDTGSSYELTTTTAGTLSAVFEDNNIDAPLASGTSNWQIRADTAEDIFMFDDVTIDISVDIATDVRIVETQDDEKVDDITPSFLSFNTIDGSESGATVSLNPLANTDVVRGASGIQALSFEVEAEDSSLVIVDEVTVRLTASGSAATRQQISAIRLYKDSVSDANELDIVSGSDIGTSGDVTFDDMDDLTIPANGDTDFIVTLTFADSNNAVAGTPYVVSLTDISIDDDDNDDITVLGANGATLDSTVPATHFVSARNITVNNAGTIVTLVLDGANEDNEFDKLALAGSSKVIASYDVRADNEEVDVETVVFTLTSTGTLIPRDVFASATLLLDGVAVETNSNSDIQAGSFGPGVNFTITFEDMDNLIIPETTSELALQLNSANIGEDETGSTILGVLVNDIVISEADGVESGKDLVTADIVDFSVANPAISRTLDVVPAVVTPSVVSSLGTDNQTAELRLSVNGGSNTNAAGDAVQAELTQLRVQVSSLTASGNLTVFNGNGVEVGTAVVDAAAVAAGAIVVNIDDASGTAGDSIGNDNETYRIEGTAEAIYRLARNGVTYTVNGTGTAISTKLENTLLIGQYADSN